MTEQTIIGILQTDSVQDEFIDEFGDYPEMFTVLLRTTARASQPPVDIEVNTYNVQLGQYPSPGDCHGYVITGSRESVYDDLPWIGELVKFLREALAAGRKVIGICFGHQLIAHFFSGETAAADVGWGVGVKSSEILSGPEWMKPKQDSYNLLCSHKDQVVRPPTGAKIFATSEFCPISGFTLGDSVLTFQGHPEFAKNYSAALMNARRELLGHETFSAGMASLDEPVHAGVVGQWMLNFLKN